jgi:hypothetical protein
MRFPNRCSCRKNMTRLQRRPATFSPQSIGTRRIAAILLSSLVPRSRLAQSDPPNSHIAFQNIVSEIIDPQCHGRRAATLRTDPRTAMSTVAHGVTTSINSAFDAVSVPLPARPKCDASIHWRWATGHRLFRQRVERYKSTLIMGPGATWPTGRLDHPCS